MSWILKSVSSLQSSHFSTWSKSQDKNLNILRTKELLRWNKIHFFKILKDFELPKIVSKLGVRLSEIIWLGFEKSWTSLLGSYYLYDKLDLDSKNTWTTLLDSDWFYDILELDLKSTHITLLDFFGMILWYIGLGFEK